MKPKEMASTLSDLGVTQAAFAEYLGVRPETVSRWINGSEPIPRYASIILLGAVHAQHLITRIKQDFLIPGPSKKGKFDRDTYHREFMREYMRKYRLRRKQAPKQGDD